MRPRLVLASASPRRRDLLEEHGYDFKVVPADVDEIAPSHLSPAEIVRFNARLKARAVAKQFPAELVVGVDTLVAFGDRVFGKPAGMDEAFAMLSELNGRSHEVFSGVCLVDSGAERSFVDVTRIQFHRRSDAELRAYLLRIGPLDKAGAYAAQDDRGEMIAHVEGSYSNVIGLPMEALERVLAERAARAR